MGLEAKLANALLIAAHPDDEMLWFSAVLRRVGQAVVCFTEVPGNTTHTEGRRAVAAAFPLANTTFLHIPEALSFAGANWRQPRPAPYGLEVRRRAGTLPGFDAARYRSNYDTLLEALRSHADGASAIISHSPWGEYGHEDHVQVHRVAAQLAEEQGVALYFTNYVSDRSSALMRTTLAKGQYSYEVLPTDLALANELEALYRANGCWTWPFEDYAYFANEAYIQSVPTSRGSGARLPLNYIDVDRNRFPKRTWLERLRAVARG